MDLLIKKAKVVDPGSDYHDQVVDILVRGGILEAIGPDIETEGTPVFSEAGTCLSPGWLDVGAQIGDPGFEHREDLRSASAAAAAGGFTALAPFPNTYPAIDSKSEVLYLKNNSRGQLVDILPVGAASVRCEGKDITEIIDMHAAGAIAFSDGLFPIQNSGLMMRVLQYVKTFGGIVINQPLEKNVAADGQMHEGRISTTLGLKGIPNMAEELMVSRDIYLAEYTGSKIHFAHVSTAGSVRLIREAKAKGLPVTASVAVMNLAFDDSRLMEFDSNFKVLPPLRSAADRAELIEGLKDGTLDFIVSNHIPLEAEAKELEFPYARFGAIGLETAFSLSWMAVNGKLTLTDLVLLWAYRPRRAFDLDIPHLVPGQPANLTLFAPERQWIYTEADIRSKSRNTPLIGMELKGKVLGVINNDQAAFFRHS